jgi:sRNA-binding carbon storage regulator CsrA
MLVLTRKPGQAIQIDLMEDLDPRTPVGELFAQGPIEIIVGGIRGDQVKLGINADKRFRILRDELCPEPAAPPIPRAATR